jgi:hypothetical protein
MPPDLQKPSQDVRSEVQTTKALPCEQGCAEHCWQSSQLEVLSLYLVMVSDAPSWLRSLGAHASGNLLLS